MKERISILSETRKIPIRLINSYKEIYKVCVYKTRFYRYKNYHTSTDGEVTPERDHTGAERVLGKGTWEEYDMG